MNETRQPTAQIIPASEVREGDRLLFGGRPTRPVDEVDPFSNVHGLLIIRYGTGWSTVDPDRPMNVLR